MAKKILVSFFVIFSIFSFFIPGSLQAAEESRTYQVTTLDSLKHVVSQWGILEDGARSVIWQEFFTNPRFLIHDPGTTGYLEDDLVLDRETGLVWSRTANSMGTNAAFGDMSIGCRNLTLGNRKGWRLPSLGEISTLIHTGQGSPSLPESHPFINVQEGSYWTATIHNSIVSDSETKFERTLLNVHEGLVERCAGSGCLGISGHAWAVRGPDYFSATPIVCP